MEQALREFIESAYILSEHWINEYPGVAKYPSYLPSFDEFVADFALMLQKDE